MWVTEENIGVTGGTNSLNLAHDHQVTEHTHSIPSHSIVGQGFMQMCLLKMTGLMMV